MAKPKLSICIPTYNRAELISKCVLHILSYTSQKIEVCVSDNASEDNTYEVLSQINDSRFKYRRNESNNGFLNMIDAVKMAKADYVLLACDEEEINLDNMDRIIEMTHREPEVAAIIGKVEGLVGSVSGEKFYTDTEMIIKTFAFTNYHMSGTVLNKKYINFRDKNIYPFYPQMNLLLQVCDKGSLINTKMVLSTMVNKGKVDLGTYKNETGEYYFEPRARKQMLISQVDTILNMDWKDSLKKYMLIQQLFKYMHMTVWNYYDIVSREDIRKSFNYYKQAAYTIDRQFNICIKEGMDVIETRCNKSHLELPQMVVDKIRGLSFKKFLLNEYRLLQNVEEQQDLTKLVNDWILNTAKRVRIYIRKQKEKDNRE